jgi:HEPN domain-containing protein
LSTSSRKVPKSIFLKAFLIYHKVDIKRTHNIKYLLTQCAKIDREFDNIEIKELSTFGVDIRYPEDFYIPNIEEVKFYYNLAKRIKNWF